MTEQEFFAELKKSTELLDWRVVDHSYIRAYSKLDNGRETYCPITAVWRSKTDDYLSMGSYIQIAEYLRLDKDMAQEIAMAADNKFLSSSKQPKYRSQLLETLGLPQEDILE